MTQQTEKETCSSKVASVAASQIEDIRLMLCPEEDDVAIDAVPGQGYVVSIGDVEINLTPEEYQLYGSEDGCGVSHEEIISDLWDDFREAAMDRFHEHVLSFDYKEGSEGEPGYFCYLISTGGPGTEIRFYTDPGFNLYRAEFWYLNWFDGASVTVTSDPTIQVLWEQFQECGAEYVYTEATK